MPILLVTARHLLRHPFDRSGSRECGLSSISYLFLLCFGSYFRKMYDTVRLRLHFSRGRAVWLILTYSYVLVRFRIFPSSSARAPASDFSVLFSGFGSAAPPSCGCSLSLFPRLLWRHRLLIALFFSHRAVFSRWSMCVLSYRFAPFRQTQFLGSPVEYHR